MIIALRAGFLGDQLSPISKNLVLLVGAAALLGVQFERFPSVLLRSVVADFVIALAVWMLLSPMVLPRDTGILGEAGALSLLLAAAVEETIFRAWLPRYLTERLAQKRSHHGQQWSRFFGQHAL
ncbi:MAG: hypothetical protein K2X99_05625 [Gemmatimonadaceae bacterium]|nr:hypothetical protein [Gemmatimonadaceae bacterium]